MDRCKKGAFRLRGGKEKRRPADQYGYCIFVPKPSLVTQLS